MLGQKNSVGSLGGLLKDMYIGYHQWPSITEIFQITLSVDDMIGSGRIQEARQFRQINRSEMSMYKSCVSI